MPFIFDLMKSVVKYLITLVAIATYWPAAAQDAKLYLKEGNELAGKRQYEAAIEKYRAALALEPANGTANYQMAFTLNASGKGNEAIPFLQKVAVSDASAAVVSSAYSLMGSIYDKGAQPQKAIDSYIQAIKADTANTMLYYNLALAYFRARQYYEAEKAVLKVLAAEPKHPGSVRLYALVTFHQNKRAPALLSLCHFLSIEPKGPSSAEAYGNMQSILKGGSLKMAPGEKAPVISAADQEYNQAITKAISNAGKRGNASSATLLSKQLSAVFTNVGAVAKNRNDTSSYFYSLANHYYQLAQTDRMVAFANFISQSADKAAATWVKAHAGQVSEEW